jgi:competence protein ComEA
MRLCGARARIDSSFAPARPHLFAHAAALGFSQHVELKPIELKPIELQRIELKEESPMNRSLSWLTLVAALLPLTAPAGPVDINTADAKTIARELKGIGLSRAQAIVDFREKNGPFRSADDLARVKGVGTKVVEQNRANIRVEKDKAEKADGAAKQKGRDGG